MAFRSIELNAMTWLRCAFLLNNFCHSSIQQKCFMSQWYYSCSIYLTMKIKNSIYEEEKGIVSWISANFQKHAPNGSNQTNEKPKKESVCIVYVWFMAYNQYQHINHCANNKDAFLALNFCRISTKHTRTHITFASNKAFRLLLFSFIRLK